MKIFLDANICLDLLDTTRATSKKSVEWYLSQKNDVQKEFFFSGDFITTLFYILTQKKKVSSKEALKAIDLMCQEITPCYISHSDYIFAKINLFNNVLDDLEDLMVLSSANRVGCNFFITNDRKLLKLSQYNKIKIIKPSKQ